MTGKLRVLIAMMMFGLSIGLAAAPQFAGAATATKTPKATANATKTPASQSLTKDTVEAGKTVTIKVTGFAANETVSVRLYDGNGAAASATGTVKATKTAKATSTPKTGATANATKTPTATAAGYTEIATFAVDATGAGGKSITIPAKTTPGPHQIAVYGKTVNTTGTITVTAASGTPTAVATTAGGNSAPAGNSADSSSNTDPTNATAKCKDGSYSHSAHAAGTCANHGGVDTWINKPVS